MSISNNKTTAGVASGTRNFSYDAAGNTTSLTSDSNINQTLAYNNAGRLTTVKNGNTILATYSYNALGQRISKTAGTTQELYVYDEAGQLIAVTNAAGQAQREYIYRDGQLASFVTLKGGPISAITFTANAAVLQNAAYSKVQTGYNSSSGYIQFNGEGQFTWTANIISPATYAFYVRYSLVGANRPLAILVDGVQAATMNFNPTADWNTWTTTPVNLTLTAGTHSITLKTTGNSGPNIDQAALQAGGGQTGIPVPTLYYSHNDHNGTPQVVTNQSKQVVWAADYQAFGKVNVTTNTVEIYSRFPGQVSDSETGLYYNWFRFYDPSIGRYLTSDPIGLEGGINTYAYANVNPLSFIDPNGLEGVGWWNDGSHTMDMGNLTDCQKEAYSDYFLNLFSFGAYADFAMDAGGVNVNVIQGDDYIETGSYDPGGSSAAVAGYAVDYVASNYMQSAQRSTARSTRKGNHYSTNNSHTNKANTKKSIAKALGRMGGLLGPLGAMYDLNEAMKECSCK